MSTPLLDSSRFANLRASLLQHGTDELLRGQCSQLNGEVFRAFGLDPWGRTSKEHGAPTDLDAARVNLKAAVSAAVFDWQRANWAAHVARYHEGEDGYKLPERPAPRLPRGSVLAPPALLKALRALRYNVDGGDASGPTVKASLETLDRLIDSLKDYCLELLPEYRDAEWAI